MSDRQETTPEDDAEMARRHGANLLKRAREAGWTSDMGEGPLEYLMARTYETGWDDARRAANGTR